MSITFDNLKNGLWTELATWRNRSPFLLEAFEWTQTKIYAKDHPETWYLSARSFPQGSDTETIGRTLSGIHAKYVLFLIDESGDIPPAIAKTAEQATGETIARGGFIKIMQAGNPISTSGLLYDASKSSNWHVIRITGDPDDPDRSPRIDVEWAREQIDKYGKDDPWIQSYLLGRFPSTAINTLLSVDEIEDAMARTMGQEVYAHAQKRLGCDVARYGTDSTIIFPRQGLASFKYTEMRNANGPTIAARILLAMERWQRVEGIFVDGTGGYGATVVDSLQVSGQASHEVNFSSKASNEKYFNKRAEMWMEMAKWVKRGGALPKCNRLKKELLAPTYSFKGSKIILESKEQIKKRLGFSPDIADSLALTFAIPDQPAADEFEWMRKLSNNNQNFRSEHDPFKDM